MIEHEKVVSGRVCDQAEWVDALGVEGFLRGKDAVAADVTRAQADLQSAAVRVVQAENELKAALINYNGNAEGLQQTQRFGDVLVQIFRPQEVVAALALLKRGYDNYFATVADYNQA